MMHVFPICYVTYVNIPCSCYAYETSVSHDDNSECNVMYTYTCLTRELCYENNGSITCIITIYYVFEL